MNSAWDSALSFTPHFSESLLFYIGVHPETEVNRILFSAHLGLGSVEAAGSRESTMAMCIGLEGGPWLG